MIANAGVTGVLFSGNRHRALLCTNSPSPAS